MDKAEQYKADGKYRFAGQYDAMMGKPAYFGCHFGMRSTRDMAVEEYHRGWAEVADLLLVK